MKKNLILTLLIFFILSACATVAETPLPTTEPVVIPTIPPTQTLLPTVEVIQPTSDEAPPIEVVTSQVSFSNQILPIFQSYCAECHGGFRVREGLNLTSYDSLMAGSFNGPVIVPGNANDSLLIHLIASGEMPERGPAVSGIELQLIMDWSDQGAQNN